MRSSAGEPRATTYGKWLLAFVVPASALALGSLPLEALVVMSVLSALSSFLLSIDRRVPTSRASLGVLIVLALLTGMTLFQVIPLPAGLIRTLSPASSEIWDRALSPLREAGPAWHSLSVAPSATRVEVLRGFFYACTFVAALRVASLERGSQFLVRVVIFSTALMAFSALSHTAVSAQKVFGLYRPHELYAYRPGHLGPLLNTNHLAAYLGMGACVTLGALLSSRSLPRALSASLTLVLAATSVWQGSRGATGALLFGMLLTVGLTFYSRRHFDSARAGGVILAACAVATAIIVSISLSDAGGHLLSHDLSKVDVARSSLGLVVSAPWFGFGRGAFESVFAYVREGTEYMTWTNPENLAIQWLVEWGVPITVAGFALLGWSFRPQVVLRAVRPEIGAWVALVAAVLHELVDYHFEVPGIVALALVCGAVVLGARAKTGESRRASSPPRTSTRLLGGALVFGTLLSICAAWPDRTHTLAEERRRLSAESVDHSVPPDAFRAHVREAMLRYPAEPFFPLMGAVRAQFVDGGIVVPWVARALERNPRFGRAHFVLARSLALSHPAQARLEYRLAYLNDAGLRAEVVRQALPLVVDSFSALELVPEGETGNALLDAMVESLGPRLPATAVILDAELARRSPTSTGPARRRAEAAASDAINDAPWCVGRHDCIDDALVAAEDVAKREPDKCRAHLLVATLLVKKGEVAKGLDGLDRAADTVSDRAVCMRQLITLSTDAGDRRRGDVALERLVRGGCGATVECVDLYSWAGAMEEQRGHYVRAVRLYLRVADLAPERDDLLQHVGEMGDRPGLLADAVRAYELLATRHPSDPTWPARIAALRARAHP